MMFCTGRYMISERDTIRHIECMCVCNQSCHWMIYRYEYVARTTKLLKTEISTNSLISSLQDIVNRHFSNIPSNDLPGDDFTAYTHHNAFQSKFYEKVYFVKPIRNITKIDITWCLEPMTGVSNRISDLNQPTTLVTSSGMKGKEV